MCMYLYKECNWICGWAYIYTYLCQATVRRCFLSKYAYIWLQSLYIVYLIITPGLLCSVFDYSAIFHKPRHKLPHTARRLCSQMWVQQWYIHINTFIYVYTYNVYTFIYFDQPQNKGLNFSSSAQSALYNTSACSTSWICNIQT